MMGWMVFCTLGVKAIWVRGRIRHTIGSKSKNQWLIRRERERRLLTTKLPPALASLAPGSTAQERRAGNFWNVI